MKIFLFFIMAHLSLSLNASEMEDFLKQVKGKKLTLVKEKEIKEEKACSHCPKYEELTGSVNKILSELSKKDGNEDLPVALNHLRFLYFMVKSRDNDGEMRCQRYMDIRPDLKPTVLNGEMQIIADQVFKFQGITTLQILDPNKEEIVYYYRGSGAQSNILVQAVLTKEGSFIRTFRYDESAEKNPYNLPALGTVVQDAEESMQQSFGQQVIDLAGESSEEAGEGKTKAGKTQYGLKIKPKLKGLKIAEGNLEHTFNGPGLKISAKSELSAKGNEANVHLNNEEGKDLVNVHLKTKLNGKTEHRIVLPYSVELPSLSAIGLKGAIIDESSGASAFVTVTDQFSEWFRGEVRRRRDLDVTTYSLTKDFMKDATGGISVSFGKNEQKARYIGFGHTKNIKNNVTMVLDVKLDENRKASFYYQLKTVF